MFRFTRNQLIAAYAIVGLALVGMIVLVVKTGALRPAGGVQIAEPGQVSSATGQPTDQTPAGPPLKISVHVAGRVRSPGVYELKPGSRVSDAVGAAGGAASDADLESINLAGKVQDGEQIYVAAKGQMKPPAASVATGAEASSVEEPAKGEAAPYKPAPKKLTKPGEGTVSINSAGLDDLQRLPGFGPAMAQRILDYRSQHGRFQAVDELREVKGIGAKKLETIRPFVRL